MTKEFPMTNAEFSLITRASGGESRGLPSRRQRGFHRLLTLCWERIGHWGYWSFTGHCGIGHWSFAPNANPLEMSRNRESCRAPGLSGRIFWVRLKLSARSADSRVRVKSAHLLNARTRLSNVTRISDSHLGGMVDNSPTFQRWDSSKGSRVPKGRLNRPR